MNPDQYTYEGKVLIVPRGDEIADGSQVDQTDDPTVMTIDGGAALPPNSHSSWTGLLGEAGTPIPAGEWDLLLVVAFAGICCDPVDLDVRGHVSYVAWRAPG